MACAFQRNTHTVTTSASGIINLNIGSATSLEEINWASGSYLFKFLLTETFWEQVN